MSANANLTASGQREEPWLRGPLPGVHPLLAPTLHAYTQAREDLAHWTEGLSDAQIWSQPFGLAPVGFHLRHIAGSVNRLTTYLLGEQLTPAQLEELQNETNPLGTRSMLLNEANHSFDRSEEIIRALDPAGLLDIRSVGRRRLETTVIGLVVHLAEHTQRHVGEVIISAKLTKTGGAWEY